MKQFPRALRSSALGGLRRMPICNCRMNSTMGADTVRMPGFPMADNVRMESLARTPTACEEGPDFDFSRHVHLSALDLDGIRVRKLSEMGYKVAPGEIDFGYSEPFRLLSEEGLRLYREAILSKPVLENCYYSCPMVPLTIRNMAAHNKFIRQMSTSEAMLLACSSMVGCDLAWHPFRVEHMMTNIQMKGKEAAKVFDWHHDSNSFVLLVNLSEIPEDGRGGGTLMQEASGAAHEVRAPGPGWAYIMQGKRVLHAANASENWTRIVSVISFCSKDTLAAESLEEDTVDLHLARNYTDHAVLDKEYAAYRLSRSMEKLCFLRDRFLDEEANNFSSLVRREDFVRHLEHLIRNLQITSSSLQMLTDWGQPRPRPLPVDEVPVTEIASAYNFCKHGC
ncbi:Kifc2 [Symbiodinium sp. CCMP2456]|nr:Kifc2 [Symbiodinium sp. CCMP2456]